MMATTKEHIGSRSDYITALALSRSQAENHARLNPLPNHDPGRPNRLQPSLIPDLRFEPTYLAKLAVAGTGFQTVVWVTFRDQVISPLIQGILWGTASVFVQPLLCHLTSWRSQGHTTQPVKEGSAAGWLRRWARSLFPDARAGSLLGSR